MDIYHKSEFQMHRMKPEPWILQRDSSNDIWLGRLTKSLTTCVSFTQLARFISVIYTIK